MKPLVSIIMGSTSDYSVMEKAALFLDQQEIPFEINALSAHRTPMEVSEFARNAEGRGIKVIIAAAGMAAALPGAIAAETTLPVIGVPVKSSFEGMDSVLSMLQMPPAVPVSVMAVNGSLNAAIMAMEILALTNEEINKRMHAYKQSLKEKIVKANEEFSKIEFKYKTN
ncbi:MAG: 5-(carboxyamino)imidazole ribonucleotide mutase [Bacteroidales bacterium]|nr:5-(carboxyamino)imidazole ribonucleotide mutase [Bacteroidales bacterium]MDY6381237.1 5-(carboxyamino)imidazole ribonucleotide mutase [Bacteroidales bacterium]MDY6394056.1 5-(carboxyamino)imidazole ribonucleotide mutase [Bacteroidales bacterium]MDY6402587.1 5-(carboxyamino)imidazole ribonucleotide mutase [Bacteroidales bacterium]